MQEAGEKLRVLRAWGGLGSPGASRGGTGLRSKGTALDAAQGGWDVLPQPLLRGCRQGYSTGPPPLRLLDILYFMRGHTRSTPFSRAWGGGKPLPPNMGPSKSVGGAGVRVSTERQRGEAHFSSCPVGTTVSGPGIPPL